MRSLELAHRQTQDGERITSQALPQLQAGSKCYLICAQFLENLENILLLWTIATSMREVSMPLAHVSTELKIGLFVLPKRSVASGEWETNALEPQTAPIYGKRIGHHTLTSLLSQAAHTELRTQQSPAHPCQQAKNCNGYKLIPAL